MFQVGLAIQPVNPDPCSKLMSRQMCWCLLGLVDLGALLQSDRLDVSVCDGPYLKPCQSMYLWPPSPPAMNDAMRCFFNRKKSICCCRQIEKKKKNKISRLARCQETRRGGNRIRREIQKYNHATRERDNCRYVRQGEVRKQMKEPERSESESESA